MASEKLKFKIKLYSTYWDKAPGAEIFVNNKSFYKDTITGTEKNPTLITFPYENFVKVNKEVFDFYDALDNENIFRIFPHKLFCNTKIQGQCLTHNETEVFFSDEWHVSIEGAEMINKLLIEKIKYINIK